MVTIYVEARSVQLGLCEWARRLVIANAMEMTAESRAALAGEILKAAHMLWWVSVNPHRQICA